MLRLMLQKLMHKKWLVISLLIGNILLVAITASYPMYKEASMKKMLVTEFNNYQEKNSIYAARIVLGHTMDSESQLNKFWEMQDKSNNICDTLGLTMIGNISQYTVPDLNMTPQMIRDGKNLDKVANIMSMSDFKNHSKILSGSEFSDTIGEDGFIDVVVSQTTFIKLNLLIGDEFICSNLKGKDGMDLKFRIVGIFSVSDEKDIYWDTVPAEIKNSFIISEDIYESQFLYDKQYHNKVIGKWVVNFDYKNILPEQVDSLEDKTKSMVTETNVGRSTFSDPAYLKVIDNYSAKVNRTQATMIILIIPVFVLLCAFIFMISGQMLSLEDSEIALFKSRGASKKQILFLYLLQSTCLSVGSLVLGLPLAGFICKVLGSANAFLEFVQRTSLTIHYSKSVLLYSLAAVAVSILITILPVIRSSAISIVNLKQKKARSRKPIWQKLYLDILLLGVSLYGFYSYNQQKEQMLFRVVSGDSVDPLLFLSSSIFILGAGLVVLRLQPLLVKLIYGLRKKKWKPANYASFLQILRTGNKQYFIMVFTILTVALGIFNSTIARTIVLNAEKNTEYSAGADLVFKESWNNNINLVMKFPSLEFLWTEPEYNRYAQMDEVESAAKVYRNSMVRIDTSEGMTSELMGINTKNFGNTAYLPEGLNNHMFNEYLNVLSTNTNAVLLSSNYMIKKGYKIGDTIEITNGDDINGYNTQGDQLLKCVVYGFVDYWPGYKPTHIETYEDGTSGSVDNYMVIANLNYVQQQWKVEPYQVWLKVKNSDTGFFYDMVDKEGIRLASLTDRKQSVLSISKDPLFQGTNGILTMSFIVILILCCIGYLIYWILSIRSRELLFGVFRAMGMSKGEIIHMLINEQLFTGGLSIVFGTIIGVIASRLYIPMIQIAYTGDNQALPLELMTQSSDMVRLFVIIAFVFVACMCVLARIVNKLKIAQALKLGED